MSIDMSQFYQVFFDEAGEHLASMESLLLGLDIAQPDAEDLNAIFRAAHSIKGSAGTFGFTDLAEVTHILENLLDRIRKGELALREEMIDAFLAAGDVLKVLLGAHKGENESDPAATEAICTQLRELTTATSPVVTEAAQPASAASVVSVAEVGTAVGNDGFDLYFVLDGGPGEAQKALDNLLAELAAFGSARVIERPQEPLQPWRVELLGTADGDEIRNTLEFIARSDSIRILPRGGDVGALGDSSDGAYGFFGTEAQATAPQAADEGDAAYGFFEPLPAVAAAPAETAAYGFFEPLADEKAAQPALAEASSVDSPDGAYGFFTPPPSQPVQANAVVSSDSPDGAYGFFGEVKPSAAEPVAEAANAKSIEKPVEISPAKPSEKEVAKKAVVTPKLGGDTSIRVGVEKVDQLINLVGELVITQAMLAQSASGVDPVQFERLINGLGQLERNTRDLQEAVMSIRMMPMSVVFSRYPRVVRELSQKLGKKVELKLIGEDTELDKGLIERITDPLTHLVRNSLDHGIEMPDDRIAKGKQPAGTITLKAYHQSGNVVIDVSDDGAGLNRQRILSKAKERGLAVHDLMTDAEVWQLIFEAGFSTADVVTEVSGRGVGMDVVKKNITSMGGRVEIESMTGIGTRMTVKLPLTLAILDGMSVAVGRETYIVPLGYVIESWQADRNMIKSVSGVERLIKVREEYLPVVALHEVFHISGAITNLEQGIMVILEADGIKAALFVDAMVGQQQVVIKSLENNYRKVSGVSGATIMGDGHVALILDVVALVAMAKSQLPAAA
jgi:two-component system chemotaxis sensor kinase CheA